MRNEIIKRGLLEKLATPLTTNSHQPNYIKQQDLYEIPSYESKLGYVNFSQKPPLFLPLKPAPLNFTPFSLERDNKRIT